MAKLYLKKMLFNFTFCFKSNFSQKVSILYSTYNKHFKKLLLMKKFFNKNSECWLAVTTSDVATQVHGAFKYKKQFKVENII